MRCTLRIRRYPTASVDLGSCVAHGRVATNVYLSTIPVGNPVDELSHCDLFT
jgi:hypothetical protein